MSAALSLHRVRMDFAKADGSRLRVLDGIDFEVRSGELFSVVGPSGCGKTTLLDLILGLASPTAGTIDVAAKRPAMVFQRPQLLPWRTVLDNALYGVECREQLGDAARQRAVALLERIGLGDHLHEHPHRLSEGMKQRVNLARALLIDPDLLLMDEPFSALDPATRRQLQDDLLALWQERGFTVVFVSHSLPEVTYLADRVAVFTDKPTTVRDVEVIDLPRPRSQAALVEYAQALEARHFAD